jgi:HD-GYP domain-containing protein (c-di-GMP phosphodiesterase class II)
MGAAQISELRHAGLLHDLGRSGISNSIWEKRGPLTQDDRERVRLHPYYTERILRRCSPLTHLARVAGSHHERLNGSGYHRGLRAAGLNEPARVLAAADAYVSLREERPYRPAHSSAATVHRLQAAVEAGALDARAGGAVVMAADEEPSAALRWPSGLSDREIDCGSRSADTPSDSWESAGHRPENGRSASAELLCQDRRIESRRCGPLCDAA